MPQLQNPTPIVRYQMGDWIIDAEALSATRIPTNTEEETPITETLVVNLRAKVMECLILLLQNAPNTVLREDLIREVWQGNEAVAEQAINNTIWSLRQSLGDKADTPKYVLTIPKKGFRIIAPVTRLSDEAPPVHHAAPQANNEAPREKRSRRTFLFACLFGILLAAALLFAFSPLYQRAAEPANVWQVNAVKALTSYTGMEYVGTVSPDGKMLAFAWWKEKDGGILHLRLADDDSRTPTAISNSDGDVYGVTWSPDSQQLAFAENGPGGRCTVWVYSLSNATKRQLTSCVPLRTPSLAWSPNGEVIAISREDIDGIGLYLTQVQNGESRLITKTNDARLVDYQPTWISNTELAFVRVGNDGSKDIYFTRLDGNIEQLTNEKYQGLHGITWSAKSNAIIYSITQQHIRMLWKFDWRTRTSSSLGIEGNAPLISAEDLVYSVLKRQQSVGRLQFSDHTPQLTRILSSIGNDSSPDYSRAKNQMAFVSTRSGQSELWLANADGTNARALTLTPGEIRRLRWSDIGDAIAYVGNCGDGASFGVCLVQVETGHVSTLYQQGTVYGTPTWSADGKTLYVVAKEQHERRILALDRADNTIKRITHIENPVSLQRQPGTHVIYVSTSEHDYLLKWDIDNDSVVTMPPLPNTETLIAWLPITAGLLLVHRDTQESVSILQESDQQLLALGQFQRRTFTEYPRLSYGPEDNAVYIELADTAFADLMILRPQ